MSVFNFQFISNQLNAPLMVALPTTMFESVDVLDIAKAPFEATPYQANKCYDLAVKALLNNYRYPTLKLCIGLHQLVEKPEQIVEHCWLELDGVCFDYLSELPNANYYKYLSVDANELFSEMECERCDTVPNIIQFYSWAQQQRRAK